MITELQRTERKQWIGGSDVAAILGCDPYRTSYDCWAGKCGLINDEDRPSLQARVGNALESLALDIAEEALGPLERNVHKSRPDLHLGSNLDGLTVEGIPVEAKTSGLFGPLPEGWGEPGSADVPERVILQVHAAMLCADADIAHVAAILGPRRDCPIYNVPRNDELIKLMTEILPEWWDKYVVAQQPPPALPSADVAKILKRTPGKIVKVSPKLVECWQELRDDANHAQKIAEDAKLELIAALGDAEGGDAGDAGMVTYLSQHRRAYYVSESSYRVLRLKAHK